MLANNIDYDTLTRFCYLKDTLPISTDLMKNVCVLKERQIK